MKKILMTGLLGCLAINVMAQKANFKMAEKFMTIEESLGSLKVEPHFLDNSDRFWYSYKTDNGTHFYLVDPEKKSHELLFDNHQLVKKLTELTGEPFSEETLRVKNLMIDEESGMLHFSVNYVNYLYHPKNNELTQAGKTKYQISPRPWAVYSPDSTYLVYAQNHNLFLMKKGEDDSAARQITTDGKQYFSYAANDKEMTTKKVKPNIKWFGDSKKFYVLRRDNRKVQSLWLVDILSGRPRLETYKYTMPGDKEVTQFELQVFDAAQEKAVKIQTDKWTDQTLTVLHAGHDSEKIIFQRKRRTCEEVDVCLANTATGKAKVLINEVAKPYFNDQLSHLSVLHDGKDLIWWSERTGYGHYYHYDREGKLKNTISSGEWVAGPITRIDTLNRTMYFEGYGKEKKQNPYYTHIYKAHIDQGGIQSITPEHAHHSVLFSKTGKYLVDNYSRVDMEPRAVVRNSRGKVVMELSRPDLKRLYEMGWKMPETFTVKAADGVTDLYGVMYKPFDFDSTKTYPIISCVYPGPHTESVPFGFSVNGHYDMALSQVGFIVVHFGHRGGSPRRNKWYHTYGHGNLRDYPLDDDKYGIEQLADRFKFIDRSKVGIYGHSGGGFMSTAALCTHGDFYTAAVSTSGNHDSNIYNQWWGETHHGLQESRKMVKDSINGDYEKSTFKSKIPNNIELAAKLKGHLMLVTGDMDNNVHPGQTLRMVNALIRAGKDFELVILPGQRHSYNYLYDYFYQRKMWFHFAKYLLKDHSSDELYEIDGYNRKH